MKTLTIIDFTNENIIFFRSLDFVFESLMDQFKIVSSFDPFNKTISP